MSAAGQDREDSAGEKKIPPLPLEDDDKLAGSRLIFGDKLIDPKDRRVCKPHSRKPAIPNPANLQGFEHRTSK